MSAEERGDLTAMLSEIRAGCPGAKDRLIRAIYGELLQSARVLMRRECRDHTLLASAVVHEAVLRLLGEEVLTEIPTGAGCTPCRSRRCARCWLTMRGGTTPASARASGTVTRHQV